MSCIWAKMGLTSWLVQAEKLLFQALADTYYNLRCHTDGFNWQKKHSKMEYVLYVVSHHL